MINHRKNKDVDICSDGGSYKPKRLNKPSRSDRKKHKYDEKDPDFKDVKSDPDLRKGSCTIAKELLKIAKELVSSQNDEYEIWRQKILDKITTILKKYKIGLVGLGDGIRHYCFNVKYGADLSWFQKKGFKDIQDVNEINDVSFRVEIIGNDAKFIGLTCTSVHYLNEHFNLSDYKDHYLNGYHKPFKSFTFNGLNDEKPLKDIDNFVKQYFGGL